MSPRDAGAVGVPFVFQHFIAMHDLFLGRNQLRNAILAHLTLDDTCTNV